MCVQHRQYSLCCCVIQVLHEYSFRIKSRAKVSDSILKMRDCKTFITPQQMLYCFYSTYTRFQVSFFVPVLYAAVWKWPGTHGCIIDLIDLHPKCMILRKALIWNELYRNMT